MFHLGNIAMAAQLSASEPQLDASATAQTPALPGFGASSACWKCKGAGTRLKPKMGARQRKRMAEGAEDDGSCGVCGGSGLAPRSGLGAGVGGARGVGASLS